MVCHIVFFFCTGFLVSFRVLIKIFGKNNGVEDILLLMSFINCACGLLAMIALIIAVLKSFRPFKCVP